MARMFYTCRFLRRDSDVFGGYNECCIHPKRPTLDGFLAKILRKIFGQSRSCIAIPGYDRNCPLYEIPPRPSSPPSLVRKL